MSFRYASGINKPGFNPLAAGIDQYKGIWSLAGQANAKALGTWPTEPGPALFSWGFNNSGQLGLSNTVNYSSPKQIGSLKNWVTVSFGTGFAGAIKTDGTLWLWGGNTSGQLGLGNTTSYSSPKQVGALTNWSVISLGHYTFAQAIKTDGTLWAWGANAQGQLGLGNTTAYSSPKQVGALTTWSKVFSGDNFVVSIKTDGTLWAWGDNTYGKLGLGNITSYSSPKQVGALTNWGSTAYSSEATQVIAIKTNGTLWAWGRNQYGQLGLNNITYYSSPKQVGALTTWATSGTGEKSAFAIKTDGTLWSWGYNAQGQLGLGNITNYSSPKQVGGLTDWLKVSGGGYNTYAIKTDGTLWSWGYNAQGQLGLGNTTYAFSLPQQVGSLTTWTTASSTNLSMIAIATT